MFYDNLKTACEKAGLKITPTVIMCGGKNGSVRNWKQGASPNSDIVIALANHLNVSTDYLLLGKETALTNEQQTMLNIFNQLSETNRAKLLERAEVLLENEKSD